MNLPSVVLFLVGIYIYQIIAFQSFLPGRSIYLSDGPMVLKDKPQDAINMEKPWNMSSGHEVEHPGWP